MCEGEGVNIIWKKEKKRKRSDNPPLSQLFVFLARTHAPAQPVEPSIITNHTLLFYIVAIAFTSYVVGASALNALLAEFDHLRNACTSKAPEAHDAGALSALQKFEANRREDGEEKEEGKEK